MSQPVQPSDLLPARLRMAGVILPALLVAALVGLDYFVLGLLGPGLSHLMMLIVGVAGVVTFSTVLFGRLSALQQRDREQSARLAALNAAGMSMTSELDRGALLQRVADQARAIGNARYAALGVFSQSDPAGDRREVVKRRPRNTHTTAVALR